MTFVCRLLTHTATAQVIIVCVCVCVFDKNVTDYFIKRAFLRQGCTFALGLPCRQRRLPRHSKPLKNGIQPHPLCHRRTRCAASQRNTHVPHRNLHLHVHSARHPKNNHTRKPAPLAPPSASPARWTSSPVPRALHRAVPHSAEPPGRHPKTPRWPLRPPKTWQVHWQMHCQTVHRILWQDIITHKGEACTCVCAWPLWEPVALTRH